MIQLIGTKIRALSPQQLSRPVKQQSVEGIGTGSIWLSLESVSTPHGISWISTVAIPHVSASVLRDVQDWQAMTFLLGMTVLAGTVMVSIRAADSMDRRSTEEIEREEAAAHAAANVTSKPSNLAADSAGGVDFSSRRKEHSISNLAHPTVSLSTMQYSIRRLRGFLRSAIPKPRRRRAVGSHERNQVWEASLWGAAAKVARCDVPDADESWHDQRMQYIHIVRR